MAGLRCSLIVFLLVLALSGSNKIEETSSGSETPQVTTGEVVPEPKKSEETHDGKNAISHLMSDPALLPTETTGDHIIGQKVLEIVKNPVNVDLNKLPSDVIDKIAEGLVTTPRTTEAKAVAVEEKKPETAEEKKPEGVEEKKQEAVVEAVSKAEGGLETTTTDAAESTTTEQSTTKTE